MALANWCNRLRALQAALGCWYAHGPDAVRFYTRRKPITQRLPTAGVREGAAEACGSSAGLALIAVKLFAAHVVIVDSRAMQGLPHGFDHAGGPGDVADRRVQFASGGA